MRCNNLNKYAIYHFIMHICRTLSPHIFLPCVCIISLFFILLCSIARSWDFIVCLISQFINTYVAYLVMFVFQHFLFCCFGCLHANRAVVLNNTLNVQFFLLFSKIEEDDEASRKKWEKGWLKLIQMINQAARRQRKICASTNGHPQYQLDGR